MPCILLRKVVANPRRREEQQGTGMQTSQCWMSTTQASALPGYLQICLDFAQGHIGRGVRIAGGGPFYLGPARSASVRLASDTVAEPSMARNCAQSTGPGDQIAWCNASRFGYIHQHTTCGSTTPPTFPVAKGLPTSWTLTTAPSGLLGRRCLNMTWACASSPAERLHMTDKTSRLPLSSQ